MTWKGCPMGGHAVYQESRTGNRGGRIMQGVWVGGWMDHGWMTLFPPPLFSPSLAMSDHASRHSAMPVDILNTFEGTKG